MKIPFILAVVAAISLVSGQNANGYKKIGYFGNWMSYKPVHHWVTDIDPFAYTHIMYAFAVLDKITFEMKIYDSWMDIDNQGYALFTGLKQRNPALKTLIALGGWNDSQFDTKYSELVSDPAKVDNFVTKAVEFIQKYNFDGLDVDWEYPGDPGLNTDKANFILLLSKLKAAFAPYGYLLTMAPSCSIKRAEIGYDIAGLARNVDFVNFMSYDIHGPWENFVDHHAPLYRRSWDAADATVVSESVDYWIEHGMPTEKIIFGIPGYGRSFRLANGEQNDILAPAYGAGPQGPLTTEDGFLGLAEICQYQQSGWTTVSDPTGRMGPYAYSVEKKTWVGWDDLDMIITKVKYAMSKKLGGIMLWELALDDFTGSYCNLGPRPISRAIDATFNNQPFDTSTPKPTPTQFPITTTVLPRCSDNGAYYADPADCQKYYRCINGEVQTFYCATGLVFNPILSVCDWPVNVPGCS